MLVVQSMAVLLINFKIYLSVEHLVALEQKRCLGTPYSMSFKNSECLEYLRKLERHCSQSLA